LVDDGRRKLPGEMSLDDTRILRADFGESPVLLVHEVVQTIHQSEFVDDFSPDEIGLGDTDIGVDLVAFVRILFQDSPGQYEAGRLPPYLAATNAPVIDVSEVADGENTLGNGDVRKLVADQPFDQDNLDFFQMVLSALELGFRKLLIY